MATPIPVNVARFTTASIAEATGGRIARGNGATEASGVTTDSRAVTDGGAFVALRGERSDGHEYVAAAARSGARVVVVERGRASGDVSCDVVEVDDTLRAWGELARAHLRAWRRGAGSRAARVVAITGSAGKTTTKELCASILRTVGACHATLGNLNNRIGLPAMALAVDEQVRFVVLEAGMSLRGEIAALGAIAEPDVAVITNVGIAHAEGVGGTRVDVAREKAALFETLRADGIAIAPSDEDDEQVARILRAHTHAKRVHSFGSGSGATYRLAERTSLGLRGSRLRVERSGELLHVELPLLGQAAAIDFVAALAAAEAACGVDLSADQIARALADHSAISGRSSVRVLGDGTLLVDDSYNANPASVRAALSTLAELARAEQRRAVVVLGEMKELGPAAAAEHESIGGALVEAGVVLAIGCGGMIDGALDRAAKSGVHVVKASSTDDAAREADALVRASDVVLVKGSRSVGAERVVELLERTRARGGA